jgi:membrane associated rhomboid family serine protease
MAFSLMADFAAPFGGMLPSLLALIVVFGLLNPEATILLMFIIPIKAKYISYGTMLITLLTFLAKANPNGAYHLGGIVFGWLWLAGPRHVLDYRRLHMMYLEWRLRRKKARFRVIDGDKDKDRPTYH